MFIKIKLKSNFNLKNHQRIFIEKKIFENVGEYIKREE